MGRRDVPKGDITPCKMGENLKKWVSIKSNYQALEKQLKLAIFSY